MQRLKFLTKLQHKQERKAFPGFNSPACFRQKNKHKRKAVDIMTNTIKLQGISGQKKGTPAKGLKVGDVIVWNYDYKSEVVEIIPSKTGKTIPFMLKSLESGNINPRKMRADRLVVVDEKEEEEPTNEIEKAIQGREETYYSIYSDVGTVLDDFTTEQLTDYYINILGCESSLRYYLEQQIIASEINKAKAV